ncbi:MAG: phosphonate ABC transporter ATP-binding protein [Synechococcus sp.]
MTTMLELRDVCLGGHNTARLDHVSLVLNAGETVALLGPSGAGKSTLLSIANGSLQPDHGTVLWQGTPLQLRPRRDHRHIGTLWQDLRLIEELNVAQNVNSGVLGRRSLLWALINLLVPQEQDACLRCMRQAGLDDALLERSVMSLSGGQRQRVALARLFRQRPQLVLADEPLSSLDPALVDELLTTLLRQHPLDAHDVRPSTTVICLHRPDLMHRFDRVIGLKHGRVVLDAPAQTISERDLNTLYGPAREAEP